jgi:hypothetical protein
MKQTQRLIETTSYLRQMESYLASEYRTELAYFLDNYTSKKELAKVILEGRVTPRSFIDDTMIDVYQGIAANYVASLCSDLKNITEEVSTLAFGFAEDMAFGMDEDTAFGF